jgi:ATP-binding cassette, subfamily B, bacterial
MINLSSKTPIRLRSSLPGRQRWDVIGLMRKPFLAEQIETYLANMAGVIEVKANALTGRVLVIFDYSVLKSDLGILLLEFLKSITNDKSQPEYGEDFYQDDKSPGGIFELIDSVDTEPATRKKAVGRTLLHNIVSIMPTISMALAISAPLTGGLPFLAAIGLGNPFLQLGMFTGLFFVTRALESASDYKCKVEWEIYATRIEHNLRKKVFSHIQKLDMAYLDNKNSSQLVSLCHEDAIQIRRFLEKMPHTVVDKLTTYTTLSLFLLWISPVSLILSMLPIPFIYLLFRRFHKRISKLYRVQGMKENEIKKLLTSSLSGIPTIKSYTSEEFEEGLLNTAGQELRKSVNDAFSKSFYYSNMTQTVLFLGVMLPLTYGGAMVLSGTLSLPIYIIQTFMVPRLLNTMIGMDDDYDLYQNTISAYHRLSDILNVQSHIISGETRLQPEEIQGEIMFEGVTFGYSSSSAIFNKFDLHIRPNSSIAIVGSSGSGKSTLVKLLIRLYDVSGGRILLDNTDIRDLNIYDLRNAFGVINQDILLFHGTVYDNILYGRLDATREEVFEAARIAEAIDFIQTLPDGFNTIIGERGQKLSGGQRQRISIARAVLKDPPILILDEATSSVDNETEAAIQRSIDSISCGRTMIFVAHRLSTIRNVDQIHLIVDGMIAEQGTHNELVMLDGFYAALWKLQTGEGHSRKEEPLINELGRE